MADITGAIRSGSVVGDARGGTVAGETKTGATAKDRLDRMDAKIEEIQSELNSAPKVLYMTVEGVRLSGLTSTTRSVPFKCEFAQAPVVTATISGEGAGQNFRNGRPSIIVRGTTTGGCTLMIWNPISAAYSVDVNLIIAGELPE